MLPRIPVENKRPYSCTAPAVIGLQACLGGAAPPPGGVCRRDPARAPAVRPLAASPRAVEPPRRPSMLRGQTRRRPPLFSRRFPFAPILTRAKGKATTVTLRAPNDSQILLPGSEQDCQVSAIDHPATRTRRAAAHPTPGSQGQLRRHHPVKTRQTQARAAAPDGTAPTGGVAIAFRGWGSPASTCSGKQAWLQR